MDKLTKSVNSTKKVYQKGTLSLIKIINDKRKKCNQFQKNQRFAYKEYIQNVQYADV